MMREAYDVQFVAIDLIDANPFQPRKIFSEEGIKELSDSIREIGLIQPISVRTKEDGRYELAGERRLRACKLAEISEVPSLIVQMEDTKSAVVALVENLQREDLNFIEEAEGYQHLIQDHGFSQKDIAEQIGKNQSTVSNKLRILKLPPIAKDLLVQHKLTERHARALLKVEDDELKIKALKQIVKNDLTVKKTEQLIESYKTLQREEKRKSQRVFSRINYKIYVNTIKQAYQAILDTGFNAEYKEREKDDYIEVVVRIPK
jgi:ParB family chromosome partitioning protein